MLNCWSPQALNLKKDHVHSWSVKHAEIKIAQYTKYGHLLYSFYHRLLFYMFAGQVQILINVHNTLIQPHTPSKYRPFPLIHHVSCPQDPPPCLAMVTTPNDRSLDNRGSCGDCWQAQGRQDENRREGRRLTIIMYMCVRPSLYITP